jgi:GTP cyclohydrolase FolE2
MTLLGVTCQYLDERFELHVTAKDTAACKCPSSRHFNQDSSALNEINETTYRQFGQLTTAAMMSPQHSQRSRRSLMTQVEPTLRRLFKMRQMRAQINSRRV